MRKVSQTVVERDVLAAFMLDFTHAPYALIDRHGLKYKYKDVIAHYKLAPYIGFVFVIEGA